MVKVIPIIDDNIWGKRVQWIASDVGVEMPKEIVNLFNEWGHCSESRALKDYFVREARREFRQEIKNGNNILDSRPNLL